MAYWQCWADQLFRDRRFEEAREEVRQLRATSLAVRNAPNLLFLQAMLAPQHGAGAPLSEPRKATRD